MYLPPIDKIAAKFWNEIPRHFSFAQSDEFIIIPNHIYSILYIRDRNSSQSQAGTAVQLKARSQQKNLRGKKDFRGKLFFKNVPP
jgi:hypothetical protein